MAFDTVEGNTTEWTPSVQLRWAKRFNAHNEMLRIPQKEVLQQLWTARVGERMIKEWRDIPTEKESK